MAQRLRIVTGSASGGVRWPAAPGIARPRPGWTTSRARARSTRPGAIDTHLQLQLLSAEPEGFPDRDNFVAMKDGGQLASATDAAACVLARRQRADSGNPPVADIRDPA